MTWIRHAISQAVAQESPTKDIHPEFVFGTIFYMFVSNVLIGHDLGVWSRPTLDGMDDWGALNETDLAVEYCGLFFTLGGDLGWKLPLKFSARLDQGHIKYHFSIGTDPDYWQGLTEQQVLSVGKKLSSRDSKFSWQWATSRSGEFVLENEVHDDRAV